MPIFRVKSVKIYTGQKKLHEYIRGVRDKYEVCKYATKRAVKTKLGLIWAERASPGIGPSQINVHHCCWWYYRNWRRRGDIGIHLHQLLFSSGLDWSIAGIASVSKPWICKRMFSSVMPFKIIETLMGGESDNIGEVDTITEANSPQPSLSKCRNSTRTHIMFWEYFFEKSRNNAGQGERTCNCQLANARPCSKIKET